MNAPTKHPNLLSMNRKDTLHYAHKLMKQVGVDDPTDICVAVHSTIAGTQHPNLARLQAHWYHTLRNTQDQAPDYTVYDHEDYLSEALLCWWVYARGYLRDLQRHHSFPPYGIQYHNRNAKTIVDVGNGIGFTTAAFRTLFPDAQVYGTNVPNSIQYKIASILADRYGFHMTSEPESIPQPVDLVFASEYFEHFQQPVDHLRYILTTLQPQRLLIANTFTSDATGHFDTYEIDGEQVPGTSTARRFNNELRSHGYIKHQTGLWNNRPAYWEKQ